MLVEQNIWGKPGCELPSGGFCSACCIFYEVLVDNKVKPAKEPCWHINKVNGGCSIHEERPPECRKGGCFPATLPNRVLDLIATALEHGMVTREEAEGAVVRVCEIQGEPDLFGQAIEYVSNQIPA